MPVRNSDGTFKFSARSKADMLNMLNNNPNFHFIALDGDVIKVNIKEILDERPDL